MCSWTSLAWHVVPVRRETLLLTWGCYQVPLDIYAISKTKTKTKQNKKTNRQKTKQNKTPHTPTCQHSTLITYKNLTPNVAPTGLRNHFGGFFSNIGSFLTSVCCCWTGC